MRLCAPVALSTLCTKLLQESLHNVARAMLIFYKQEQQVSFDRVIFLIRKQVPYFTKMRVAGFRSRGAGKYGQVHGMLERAIDSLHSILHTRNFSTRPNCDAFRNICQCTPKRGTTSTENVYKKLIV